MESTGPSEPLPAVEPRLRRLTALVGVGYFFVWALFGMAACPLRFTLAMVAMQQPSPWNVSHRLVSASPEPPGPSSSGQGCC